VGLREEAHGGLPLSARLRDEEARRAFIEAHTARVRVPLVPEIELALATEVTPLWSATEAWLEARGIEPPFWAFAWAGGQALARMVLDRRELVRDRRVFDLATGCGIVAIAAALAGAREVVAVDLDPLACAAARLNAARNGATIEVVEGDLVAVDLGGAEVIVAGDVFYDREASARFAPRLAALARRGARVLVGDPGRAYLPEGLVELARYEVPVSDDVEGAPVKAARALEFVTPSTAARRA
jgi:predicted nicotinamide N-methyase